jgi:hypothetical protein
MEAFFCSSRTRCNGNKTFGMSLINNIFSFRACQRTTNWEGTTSSRAANVVETRFGTAEGRALPFSLLGKELFQFCELH